jgi:hypothetical protein
MRSSSRSIFRPPDTNIGVGAYAGVPPHLVAQEFLDYFNIERGSAYAYAHTMVDYVDLARTYGKAWRSRPHGDAGQGDPRRSR